MGKAGQVLKQVLETHNITQYKLAKVMGIQRNNVSRWVREERELTAENVLNIVRALKQIDPVAAQSFVDAYLVDELQSKD
ncbi:helix-turn-helix transcriptional regulator [Leptodesmis sichuanensis]|uniref:helix-turn-helix transcriptional regulator n=1 Tax=Leptodesmis sichuanensis TaxID=2906798 RepID=UPI001F4675AC|nr:helix-turn-helix transcriptional regulator [Leptodesmis sichuanensis]UIE36202.1 helix-turn-helix transcriptional regulator [Leptodesmis sichuanensis A121]